MNKYTCEIKWAVIFCFVMLIWMLMEKLLGWHSNHIDKQQYLTNLFAIPAIAVYVFALREKRNKDFNGKMTWLQGFLSGFLITVIVTILSPLTQYITSVIITPEFFPNAIEYATKSGKMTIEKASEFFTLKNYIIQGLIGSFVMGAATSAIVAVFVKRK